MATAKKDKVYIEAVGRRKTSVARVRITDLGKDGGITVNDKEFAVYFPTAELRHKATAPLVAAAAEKMFAITVLAKGGGIHSQAEAVTQGLARALVKYNAEFKAPVKTAGLLTRDPRAKERRKFGLKKARKSPQWSKR